MLVFGKVTFKKTWSVDFAYPPDYLTDWKLKILLKIQKEPAHFQVPGFCFVWGCRFLRNDNTCRSCRCCCWFRNPANHLRLVVLPIICRVFYIQTVVGWDFWIINSIGGNSYRKLIPSHIPNEKSNRSFQILRLIFCAQRFLPPTRNGWLS